MGAFGFVFFACAHQKSVDAEDIVLGDIVTVNSGDRVPADLVLLSADDFYVDNSSLTGEAEPILLSTRFTSDSPLETENVAFSSSLCLGGTARGIVIRFALVLIGDNRQDWRRYHDWKDCSVGNVYF